MTLIANRGDKGARIWIICERPYSSDEQKGYVFSGGMGSVFSKMLSEAGLNINECFVAARRPHTDNQSAFQILENDLNQYQPPFILVLNEAGACYLPELRSKGDPEGWRGQLQKNAGSLLSSTALTYPHYMMPVYGPDRCVADWCERNVTTYVDLQKLRDEYQYWKKNGTLQALPQRSLVYGNLELGEILQHLNRFQHSPRLSVDIETVYPREKSAFHPHPGYPITIGIADSARDGISFNLFRDSPEENRILWRALDITLSSAHIIGQNFFNFDALFLESLGFRVRLGDCSDTLLRHHILWPELSHKLQFMTRQYTRQPYYKDEGHGWSVKNMDRLRRYNCLDVVVTYEIWEQQEEEFKQRPHLR